MMPLRSLSLCFLLLLLPAGQMPAGDFGRFQVILDQQVLGRPEPAAPVAPPAPTPPPAAPGWANEYRMTMMTKDVESGQIRVGLQNVRDNTGHLLIQGDPPSHGFSLRSAEFDQFRAVIQFQGASHTFTLETGSAPPAPAADTGRPGVRRTPTAPPPPRPRQVPQPPPEDLQEVNQAEPRFRTQEELQAHLEQVQMDAIRSGRPPLPIPLTPEMDAQLVREGVLPPQDQE